MKRVFALAATLALAFACNDSVDADLQYDEPVRFGYLIGSQHFDAQFFPGDMPAPGDGPKVAGIDVGPNQVAPGTKAKGGYTIRVADNAYTIALRLAGRTNGYWIARVNQVEAINANQVSAAIVFDIAPSMATGKYNIEISAIDRDQRFGPRDLAPLDVIPRIPANAATVISLHWDAPVDLDLQLAAPDGTFLSPKHPTTLPTGQTDAGAPGSAHLDGDSMAACVDDGYRQEDVVWTTPPLAGTYKVYVNPFSLCRQLGTAYRVTVTRNGVQTDSYGGRISAAEVQQGGFQLGDFVADVTF